MDTDNIWIIVNEIMAFRSFFSFVRPHRWLGDVTIPRSVTRLLEYTQKKGESQMIIMLRLIFEDFLISVACQRSLSADCH